MPSVTEMRTWLRDQGHDVPERGRLRPDLVTAYEDAHPKTDDDWDLADLDSLESVEDLEPSVPLEPERPPRTARAARAQRRSQPVGARAGRIASTLLGSKDKPKSGAKKKAPPRMSLEKFTSRMYTSLGRMVSVVSQPTGNCLKAQAAMAGVILNDTVQGTVLDRLLQPAARAEDKLDKGFALIAPPIAVFAIEQTQVAMNAGSISMQQGMVRLAFLQPMLRESLRIGLEVAESYGDAMVQRIAEDAKREAQVDDLIAMIFAQPVPEPEMAETAA